jgi:hypothetical protein
MLKGLDGLSFAALQQWTAHLPDLRMALTGLWHAYLWLESMNILEFQLQVINGLTIKV